MKTTVFALYETDQWMTRSSRIFLGIFSTREKAIDAFKKNGHFSNQTEIDVVECTLDEYSEI